MSSVQTARLGRTTAAPATGVESLALYRVAFWALLAGNLVAGWGVQWDIQWHVQVGRDSFWIAPHVMTYGGVALVVLVSFSVLARDTFRQLVAGRASMRRPVAPMGRPVAPVGTARVAGLTGTPGFYLAACGIALTVLAAPIDDLWHRLFGIDVTLWSPPHLLGLFGVTVNTLACLLIVREAYPARGWARYVGLVIAASMFFGSLGVALRPTGRLAFLYGGISFYSYPILAALLLPMALVAAARLTGRRSAPLVVLAIAIAVGMIGAWIARVGFDIIQPVSVIQEEIAKDPTSPIAVAHAIAQKNRTTPGGAPGGNLSRLLAFVPMLVMVALDPRRRPVAATLGYAMGVFAVWGFAMGLTPAFRPMFPGMGPTAVALLLTLATALGGGLAAAWLADRLERAEHAPVVAS
jgi:hypothetical protein